MKKIQMLAKPKLKQDFSAFWLNTRASFNKNKIISDRIKRSSKNAKKHIRTKYSESEKKLYFLVMWVEVSMYELYDDYLNQLN